jgi:hypothetical protein
VVAVIAVIAVVAVIAFIIAACARGGDGTYGRRRGRASTAPARAAAWGLSSSHYNTSSVIISS